MRVVFLDVDGVLNHPGTGYGGSMPSGMDRYHHSQLKWDQSCVNRLRALVEETGSVIVLTTYWRLEFSEDDFRKFFATYGWPDAPIHSKTPDLSSVTDGCSLIVIPASRAQEVFLWLKIHGTWESQYVTTTQFVIFDDLSPAEFCSCDPDTLPYDRYWPTLHASFVRTDENTGLSDENVARALNLFS